MSDTPKFKKSVHFFSNTSPIKKEASMLSYDD